MLWYLFPSIQVIKSGETMGKKYCPYDLPLLTAGSGTEPSQSQRCAAEAPGLGVPGGCQCGWIQEKKLKGFKCSLASRKLDLVNPSQPKQNAN